MGKRKNETLEAAEGVEFTYYHSHLDKGTNRHRAMSWADVHELLTTHTERVDKVGLGFSPCSFVHTPCMCEANTCPRERGHALNVNVREIYMFPLDLDRGVDGQDLQEVEARQHIATIAAKGLAFIAHTSHSYAPPLKSKWHVFLPLSRPVLPGEYRRFWKATKMWLGVPSGITTDFPARFWNAPSCGPGAPRDTVSQSGPHLDVDHMLSLAEPEATDHSSASTDSAYGPASESLIAAVCDTLGGMGEAVSGQGGDPKTYAVCRVLLNDYALSEAEAWPILEAWNAKCCVPPWDADGLAHKMSEAGSTAWQDYGSQRANHDFLQALSSANAPQECSWESELLEAKTLWQAAMEIGDTPKTPAPLFMSGPELVGQAFPAAPWIIRGVLTKGGIGTISTEPKAGKTWAATEYCLAIASGTKCFGEYEVEAGATAYFYAEDPGNSVQNRIKALCVSRGGVPERFFAQPRGRSLDICDDASVITLLASARRIADLKLLVIDPLRDVHTGAEDSSDEMSGVMRRLRALSVLLDCAVIFIHHTAKGGADTSGRRHGQRMRGSGAIHGAMDHGLYMYDTKIEDGKIINTCYVELKSAKAVGRFVTTLDIVDDPQTGTAVHARWSVSEPGDGCDDEGISELIEVIGNSESRLAPAPTEREIHKVVGGVRTVLNRTLAAAEAKGYLAKNMLGSVAKGWILTDQGKQAFGEINDNRGV